MDGSVGLGTRLELDLSGGFENLSQDYYNEGTIDSQIPFQVGDLVSPLSMFYVSLVLEDQVGDLAEIGPEKEGSS